MDRPIVYTHIYIYITYVYTYNSIRVCVCVCGGEIQRMIRVQPQQPSNRRARTLLDQCNYGFCGDFQAFNKHHSIDFRAATTRFQKPFKCTSNKKPLVPIVEKRRSSKWCRSCKALPQLRGQQPAFATAPCSYRARPTMLCQA